MTQVYFEDGARLELTKVGEHFELRIGQVPILSSARLETEIAFGRLARSLSRKGGARVLLGGLGFGATLGALLASVGPHAEVIVVEKLRTVVEILRGPLAHLAGTMLDDPRVRLVQDDVVRVIERERSLDVILLDVDNGPEWASFRSNQKLYGPNGLSSAKRALVPGGAYAVWSGYPVDRFLGTLARAGFRPSVVPLWERGQIRARAYVGRLPEAKSADRGRRGSGAGASRGASTRVR